MYDQLAKHEIPWTDQSVKDALTVMADVVGDSSTHGGRNGGRPADGHSTRSAKVFSDDPEAAMDILGDFAPGVVKNNRSSR